MRVLLHLSVICIIGLLALPTALAQSDNSTDPLVRILVTKGVITTEEARAIVTNASPAEQRDRLAVLLRDKGVISAAEFAATRTNPPATNSGVARDARRFGGRGTRSDLFTGNLQYKWNEWVTFGYEQGYYRTRANNRAGALPLFRGIPSFTTHNIRSEFAAIFSF